MKLTLKSQPSSSFINWSFQVCGSMPFDDSNIKKMIKYQLERKVGFSRSRKLTQDVKDLIHSMLEADVKNRSTMVKIQGSAWLQQGRVYKKPAPIEQGTASEERKEAVSTPAPDIPPAVVGERTDAAAAAVEEVTKGVQDLNTS